MMNICGQPNTVRIRYSGSVGTHLVPSPMKRYPNYGLHTNGDVFCVSVVDQEVAPGSFVLLPEEPIVVSPAPPVTAIAPGAWVPEVVAPVDVATEPIEAVRVRAEPGAPAPNQWHPETDEHGTVEPALIKRTRPKKEKRDE